MLPTSGVLFMGLLFVLSSATSGHQQYFRNDVLQPSGLDSPLDPEAARQVRQAHSQTQTDLTVRAILEWLQGRSAQPGRKARDNNGSQGPPARQYLPAAETDANDANDAAGRPRPFQPNPSATAPPPPSPDSPTAGGPTGYPYQPSPQPPFPTPSQPFGEQQPPGDGDVSPTVGGGGSGSDNFPTGEAGGGDGGSQLGDTQIPSQGGGTAGGSTGSVVGDDGGAGGGAGGVAGGSDGGANAGAGGGADGGGRPGGSVAGDAINADGQHPPHIHSIDVQCAKDQMVIDIEFDQPFNGVIYSKGFYKQDACRYVNENSGQTRYSITVRLDSCGTQFVDQFAEGGQAYLENVLVLQNEPGIQEVWDTVRRVRCLWEGNINKALRADLSVDMLSQETVTFSGDTAVARLDIQMGRGPFGPKATGLVKIGETMTLVVSVEGDADFDVGVRDCAARDASGANQVRLTDERGCVLRPKLMGAFQKTRASDAGAPGGGVVAYAFFQAFKFPDVMDLTLECNVELCKTDCQTCPDPNQSADPQQRRRRRRRRDLWGAWEEEQEQESDNATMSDPVRVYRTFRVVSPDDLQEDANSPRAATVINLGSPASGVCMSVPGLLLTAGLLVAMLLAAAAAGACLWLRLPSTHAAAAAAATRSSDYAFHPAVPAPPYMAHAPLSLSAKA